MASVEMGIGLRGFFVLNVTDQILLCLLNLLLVLNMLGAELLWREEMIGYA